MYGMSYTVRGFPCRQSLAKTAIFNDTINLHNHNIVNIKCKSLTNEVWLNEFLIGMHYLRVGDTCMVVWMGWRFRHEHNGAFS